MSTISKSTDARVRVLADGTQIPLLGLGVWQVANGPTTVNAVRWALELGYRHIDTAQAYGNEESVGRALRDSGVPRDEVFVTTKFYPAREDPAAEAEQSLRRLGVDQVDLYIIHWPQAGPTWAWPGMQRELPMIAKSTHRERIEENAQIFDFTLSDEDMAQLDALDETGGTDRALERKWW